MGLFKKILLFFFIAIFLNACGGFKRSDVKDNPINDADKRKKNIEEGRGITIGKTFGQNSGSFNFATSNEMWRASMEVLDFVPLATVDYGGGIIITDWFSEDELEEEIKISVRFLTNEIRSDSLKVKVYTKNCESADKCTINEENPEIKKKLISTILTKASKYKQEKEEKKDD